MKIYTISLNMKKLNNAQRLHRLNLIIINVHQAITFYPDRVFSVAFN